MSSSSQKSKSVSRLPGGLRKTDREKFSCDLDILFDAAFLAGNFAAALKAKELIGKERGFFKEVKKPHPFWDLGALSNDDLEKTVLFLEEALFSSKKVVKTDT